MFKKQFYLGPFNSFSSRIIGEGIEDVKGFVKVKEFN